MTPPTAKATFGIFLADISYLMLGLTRLTISLQSSEISSNFPIEKILSLN